MISVISGYESFSLQLHAQAHHVESALLQVANVAAQLLVVHLVVLLHFLLEICRASRAVRGRWRPRRGGSSRWPHTLQGAVPALLIYPAVAGCSAQWARSAWMRRVMVKLAWSS